MDQVHGPGPWGGTWWSMDRVHEVVHGPRSMFCIRPISRGFSDPEPRSQRVVQNFSSLYSRYPAKSVPGPSSSARNNSYRPPPPKKLKKTGCFQLKETWKHYFFCLASKAATIVPPHAEKIGPQNAGLRCRKVVLPCRASSVDVFKVL